GQLVVLDLHAAGRDPGLGVFDLDFEAHDELLAGSESLDPPTAAICQNELSVMAAEIEAGRYVETAGHLEDLGDGRGQCDIGRVLGAVVAEVDQEDGLAADVDDPLPL